MKIIVKTLIISFFQIMLIKCITVCNKNTNVPPTSEYHCSGLKIDTSLDLYKDDKYCCFWTYMDSATNKVINQCSSINEKQFNELDEYIYNKTLGKYKGLDIKCVEDQKIYCSNVVLDEEEISNCNDLAIYIPKDKYCCRWMFEDSENYMKKNDYCASINDFEYLNIKQYIEYKTEDPEQRYNNLKIDCKGEYISSLKLYILSLLLSLFL